MENGQINLQTEIDKRQNNSMNTSQLLIKNIQGLAKETLQEFH